MKNALLLPLYFFLILAGANGQTVQDSVMRDTLKGDTTVISSNPFQNEIDSNFTSNSTDVSGDTLRFHTMVSIRLIGCLHQVGTCGSLPRVDFNYSMRKFNEEEINKLRPFTVNDLVSQTAGVLQTQNGLSFKGSREDGTAYYLDGMRLINPILYVSNELLIK